MTDKYYVNYHKHTHVSNIFSCDTPIKEEDYIRRLLELDDKEKIYFTTEHGTGGDIFNAKTLCDKAGMHCKYGIEGYIVPQYFQGENKDNRNYHIVIIPKTNAAREELNVITSKASIEGFYYRPRLTTQDMLSLNPADFYITTACIGGILKDSDGITRIFEPLVGHFKRNLLLEVQPHLDILQVEHNKMCVEFARRYNLPLISACDSHYIYERQADERKEFLLGKRKQTEADWNEGNFMLDYPCYDEILSRYKKQGVLSAKQAEEALEQTLIFLDCEDIALDKEIKMPSLYPNMGSEEKVEKLRNLILQRFEEVCENDGLNKNQRQDRLEGLRAEFDVIEQTEEINTADYFLLNDEIIRRAIAKGGVLTRSGRGSCGSYYINRALGITQIDRYSTTIPMYPERFMSTARLLENKAMPDIDLNIVEQEPFVEASRELLGENGCFPMIAYGKMKLSEAFRNVCRAADIAFEEYNPIAKNLDDENPSVPAEWQELLDSAKTYTDIIVSASVHPCAHVLSNDDIIRKLGVVRIGDAICAMITSTEADQYKWLKDDFLIVKCWKLIAKVFNEIKQPILPLKALLNNVKNDERIWGLYANGITSTLNQIDSEYATNLVRKYKPATVEELTFFVAALRPSFNAWRDKFLKRESFETGIKQYDEIMKPSGGMPIFQESLMVFFEWLKIPPGESIGLIKKISKKKIKPEDFEALETNLKNEWLIKTGSMDGFDKIWSDIQSMMAYGFAAPHAYATAIDSLYGAYLKVNYPLEYYTVCFNEYKNDEEKTKRLTDELKYFGIKLIPMEVGFSKGEYTMFKETNSIAKGVGSVKYLNSDVADGIFEITNSRKFTYFSELIPELKEKLCINKRQIETLIAIDYFRPFGNIPTLSRILNMLTRYHFGAVKKISKNDLSEREYAIIAQSCTDKNAKGETLKSFAVTNPIQLLKDFEDYIKNLHLPDVSLKVKMQNQQEFTGSVDVTTNAPADRQKLIIMSNPIPLKSKNQIWARRLQVRSVGTGKEAVLNIRERIYQKEPIRSGDIIYAFSVSKNEKGYWYLNTYQLLE